MVDSQMAKTIVLALVWCVMALAGITFIRTGLREQSMHGKSFVRRLFSEIRFRFRIALGVAMLLFVASSVIWVLAEGR